MGRGSASRAVLLRSERTGQCVVGKVMLLEDMREPEELKKVAH